MQLYAFDETKQVVFAREARRQKDYFCPECEGILHVRGGLHRQDHFYHLAAMHQCRQSGKSIEHLNVQLFFLNLLPPGECFLERRFPEIGRIADVVWSEKKIVFEIQCSFISRQEVQERNRDYLSLDYEPVWILHDSRFNRDRLTGAEVFLYDRPHYFTDMNEKGEGMVYDRFSRIEKGRRIDRLESLIIDITCPKKVERPLDFSEKVLGVIEGRLKRSSLYFSNDLVDRFLNATHPDTYLDNAFAFETNDREPSAKNTLLSKLASMFVRYIVRPYRLIFQVLLEKACK